MIERFADEESGGFFETSADHEQLVARRKDLEDHPIPAGNSSAAYGLLRLAALTGEHEYERRAVSASSGCCTSSRRSTRRRSRHLLQALDFHLAPIKRGGARGRRHARRSSAWCAARFRPHLVLAGGEPDGVPLLRGPRARRRPRRRLRLRALRLQGAGDRAGGARAAARLKRLAVGAVRRRARLAAAAEADEAHRLAVDRHGRAAAGGQRARRAAPTAMLARSFRARRAAGGGAALRACPGAGARAT